MKKNILLAILLLYISNCFAQDTVKEKNRLLSSVVERYFVLKSDKQIKQGLYQAIYRHNTALASGKYLNNKKTGVWHFYDTDGKLVENFDYDHNGLMYEEASDSLTQMHILYSFDNKINASDHLTKPIKPGGRCYGYLSYMKVFMLSDDFRGTDLSLFSAVIELLVSPGGRLADFKVHIKSSDFERITSFSTELLSDEDKQFIPATLNGEPVLSRIFIKCKLTNDGELDLDDTRYIFPQNRSNVHVED